MENRISLTRFRPSPTTYRMRSILLYFLVGAWPVHAAVLQKAWLMKDEVQLQIEETDSTLLFNLELKNGRVNNLSMHVHGPAMNTPLNARELWNLLREADDSQVHVTRFLGEDEFFGPVHDFRFRLRQNEMSSQERLKIRLRDWLQRALTHCELELKNQH